MSSISPKDVAHLSKFNGSNYPFWKFQISMIFKQFELMDIVAGKEKLPPRRFSSSDDGDSHKRGVKAWQLKDNSACSCLIATLEERIQRS